MRLAFVIQLPFRFRVGEFYRHRFLYRDRYFEILIRNQLTLSSETQLHKVLSGGKQYNELWTETLIVIEKPKIDDDTLNDLRNWDPDKEDQLPIRTTGDVFEAMGALNCFVIAYATATNQLFGGRPLRLFRPHEFFDHLRWQVVIVYPPGKRVTDEDCRKIFDLKPEKELVSHGPVIGEMYDLPANKLAVSIEKALSRQNDFIHYEVAFEAKSKMAVGDYAGALLMAVAALEGAHAAFIQHELGSKLAHSNDKHLSDEFLKELGMSLCNRLTPYLFMDETERPPPELIKKCGFGIRIRNEIMHALKNKRGQYRLGTRTNKDLSEAYSAVLKTYNYYVAAIEKRLEAPTYE
jgi:hypothetical protein